MDKTIECPSCKTLNYEDSNFCTMCGYPLTPEANLLFKQRKTTAKLELVHSLIDEVEDVDALKKLKEFAEKLSK